VAGEGRSLCRGAGRIRIAAKIDLLMRTKVTVMPKVDIRVGAPGVQDVASPPAVYKDIWVLGTPGSGYEAACNAGLRKHYPFYHVIGSRPDNWHPQTWVPDFTMLMMRMCDTAAPPSAMWGTFQSVDLCATLPWAKILYLKVSDESLERRVSGYRKKVGLQGRDGGDARKVFESMRDMDASQLARLHTVAKAIGKPELVEEIDGELRPDQLADLVKAKLSTVKPVILDPPYQYLVAESKEGKTMGKVLIPKGDLARGQELLRARVGDSDYFVKVYSYSSYKAHKTW